ncbi:MAG TPA: ATP-binding protein [Sphingomonas sp.]|nr:ATP-binding protein [Sphingomonas sp.]
MHWRTILLVVAAVLGIGVLTALVITISGADRERDRALKLQSHSYEVMILTGSLASTIRQAEATLGRYVISGDRKLGQLYFEQWQRAGLQLDRLDEVTGDDRSQQERIDRLRQAYHTRGQALSDTALSTFYHKNSQALARFYQARASESLNTINHMLDDIVTHERALLGARTTTARDTVDRANRVVKILVAFGTLIVLAMIVLGWLAVRTLGERAAARAEAAAERSRVESLEEAIAEATAELKQQVAENAETEAKLRQVQKMEAVGQLTGGIAHDFNNMLAVVLGGLELARRNLTTDAGQATRYLDNATEGANRAATLTRRLLAFSRAEALLPEAIDASALIAGMTDLLDRTIGDTITVETRTDETDWHIWADRHQLENALLNLAVNARDAMEGRGTLTIAVDGAALAAREIGHCLAGDYVRIAVSDTGCGMTPEVLERVFEPFFTTKPVGKGTGLGLSQIFGFVRQSDGEIAIASIPDEGTTVTVYLPRHAGETVIVAEGTEDEPARAAAVDPIEVLVVEDDPRVLAATTGAIEELGHRPIACGDPLLAPTLLARHPEIELIVSDVLMPGQTGPEMIAALAPQYAHVAVLFVTGYAGDATGEDFGGHTVLRKPFTLAALESAIGAALAVDRPGPPHRLAAE